MRQFYLKRPFFGARALAKNFQYKSGSINDLSAPGFFKIALLHWRELTIHADHTNPLIFNQLANFLHLALAKIGSGPDCVERKQQ